MTFNFFPRDQLFLFALRLKRWLIYKDWLKMQMIFFWPFYPWKNKIITYVTMLPAEVFGLLHHPLGHRISVALHSQHYIGRKQMHWKNKHNYQTALTLLLTKLPTNNTKIYLPCQQFHPDLSRLPEEAWRQGGRWCPWNFGYWCCRGTMIKRTCSLRLHQRLRGSCALLIRFQPSDERTFDFDRTVRNSSGWGDVVALGEELGLYL